VINLAAKLYWTSHQMFGTVFDRRVSFLYFSVVFLWTNLHFMWIVDKFHEC